MFRLDSHIWLTRSLEEVFAFFADARNLETITPSWLKFEIVTQGPINMQVGTLIDYRLKLHGIPFSWQSAIRVWDPPNRFVDEQLKGPYRHWRHDHIFEERDGRTLVRDHVDYAVPGGYLINGLLVRRDVERIFDYRRQRLEALLSSGRSRDSLLKLKQMGER
jgi:ligand-binding SRPBCC domain-containing protein